MTLKLRFSGVFLAYTAAILSSFAGSYYLYESSAARLAQKQEQEKALEKVVSVCREAYLVSSAVVALDYLRTLARDPAVRYAACLDSRGLIQAHSEPRWIGGPKAEPDGSVDERAAPVPVGQGMVGSALVGYDLAVLEDKLRNTLWGTLRRLAYVGLGIFAAALLVVLGLAASLTRPIAQLVDAVRAIGSGNLEHRTLLFARRDEIGFLAQEINVMAGRLKELDELKDEFISSVSHDLRNPLVAIRMSANFVINEDEDRDKLLPRHRATFASIIDNVMGLDVFVTNVLDAAKMKAGRMEYHLQPADVASIAGSVTQLFALSVRQKNIDLRSSIEPSFPPVLADPERLGQVLANLISNAVKFTPKGGKVELRARIEEGKALIEVADNGKGISKEDVPRLFQKFFQSSVSEQRKDGIKGTGLGLAIVKRSVEGMGGGVEVRSELGAGTVFALRLPLAAQARTAGGR
ncbi:MAG: HAMP domain-containing histidine kinase [Elusimicrobia bacterium]|nr:HAMP domain-containing histidine kinase [Elusimicrobiota bacterium]